MRSAGHSSFTHVFASFCWSCSAGAQAPRVTELRTRYVSLLRQEGRLEEATDLLIEIGDLRQAVEVAEQAIGPVIERLDLTVANRWISALTPHPRRLVTAPSRR